MDLNEFITRFGTEKKCISFIKNHREKKGICCPKCKSEVKNWRAKHLYWRCKCGRKISLKSGTIMEATKLDYTIWFKAIFLMTHIKKSYSILELSRLLGIKRYRTVWYLTMKIRMGMGKNLLAKEYFQFYYILSNSSQNEYNINELKHHSISAIHNTSTIGEDEINLIAPLQLQWDVYAEENRLRKTGYRCLKIFGAQNDIELKNPITPIKTSIQSWMNKLLSNSNRILKGAHHGVSYLHIQKYMFEFSFNYNGRRKDKFEPLISSILED